IVTAVIFAPLVIAQVTRGTPLGILADPGFPVVGSHSSAQLLMVGFPTQSGWDAVLNLLAIDWLTPTLLTTLLIAPLLVMSLLGLFLPGSRIAVVGLLIALAGLATALAAQQVQVATAGAEPISVWTGAGLSVYWLGFAGAAMVGMRALGRFGKPFTAVTTLALVALVVPLGWNMITGGVAVSVAPDRTLPAYVAAEASRTPRVATLQLIPQTGGGVRALIQRDLGAALDDQSTLAQTSTLVDDGQQKLAELAGNLVLPSGADPLPTLREYGIQFIVLAPPASNDPDAQLIAETSAVALNQKTELVFIGDTSFGKLWRVNETIASVDAPSGTHDWYGSLVLTVQLLILGATLLLAIPAGVGRETKPVRVRRRTAAQDIESGDLEVSDELTDDVDGAAMAVSESESASPESLSASGEQVEEVSDDESR
ncbi:MAG: hypothetical protein ACKOXM_06540, partial [Agromyces sp.]